MVDRGQERWVTKTVQNKYTSATWGGAWGALQLPAANLDSDVQWVTTISP